jgi:hypothetical protein
LWKAFFNHQKLYFLHATEKMPGFREMTLWAHMISICTLHFLFNFFIFCTIFKSYFKNWGHMLLSAKKQLIWLFYVLVLIVIHWYLMYLSHGTILSKMSDDEKFIYYMNKEILIGCRELNRANGIRPETKQLNFVMWKLTSK